MTHADKKNESNTFRSDPANIQIRIGINPEIRIEIPDHFRLIVRRRWSSRFPSALVFILFSSYFSVCAFA